LTLLPILQAWFPIFRAIVRVFGFLDKARDWPSNAAQRTWEEAQDCPVNHGSYRSPVTQRQ
jgi:hypothetical protein